MSETFFPVNDLMRRRLQTSLIIISLALSVASTVFLLLFSDRIGLGISLSTEGKLTTSLSTSYARFTAFTGFLIFAIGAIVSSFMVFVMMSQRTKDVGLIRAVGCPNSLVFGYFMNELLMVILVSCVLGAILGATADLATSNFLTGLGFQLEQKAFSFWQVLLVVAGFFILALISGTKPILDTTKVAAVKAMSPAYYMGLGKESGLQIVSRSGLVAKMALRSLFRRKSATIRIVLCLTAVFILVTVAVAGGIIADQTTKSWVEKAIGRDVVVVAHKDVLDEYRHLLSEFYETSATVPFNYTSQDHLVPQEIGNHLNQISGIINVDERLIVETRVREIQSYTIDPEMLVTKPVGDNREHGAVVIGIDPDRTLGEWTVDGERLKSGQRFTAMIGDSLAQTMFSMPLNQSISLFGRAFDIRGVCIEPINNGFAVYIPLSTLQNMTGVMKPNMIVTRIDPSADRATVVKQMETIVAATDPAFGVYELDEILDRSLSFVGYLWSTVMLLPLFSLISVSLCLASYMTLTITDEWHDLSVLKALGARPNTVMKIASLQSLVVLVSSCAIGISLGVMSTLMILIPDPVVTNRTLLEVAAWLLASVGTIFLVSLYPVLRFSRKPILQNTA